MATRRLYSPTPSWFIRGLRWESAEAGVAREEGGRHRKLGQWVECKRRQRARTPSRRKNGTCTNTDVRRRPVLAFIRVYTTCARAACSNISYVCVCVWGELSKLFLSSTERARCEGQLVPYSPPPPCVCNLRPTFGELARLMLLARALYSLELSSSNLYMGACFLLFLFFRIRLNTEYILLLHACKRNFQNVKFFV